VEDQEPLKIQVFRKDLEDACEDGFAYGWIRAMVDGRMESRSVYIDPLGEESEFSSRANLNSKTERRIFRGCTVHFAYTDNGCDKGDFYLVELDQVVILIAQTEK
jgi:hypothetical protein